MSHHPWQIEQLHLGDSVNQYGDHDIGIVKNRAPVAAPSGPRELATTVRPLRDQLPAEDREVPDGSLEAAGDGDTASPSVPRRALGDISGAASPVTAGAPVVEPVRQITGSPTA
ncbi:hypothetical protein ACIQI7_30855 [Kitasatospora sp. NPDC092039]|uniref:hypothetical protein n=1 Tax=Kitasatospora sp. NPDC092039 TaxID=3364086 RepID=UPI0037F89FE0